MAFVSANRGPSESLLRAPLGGELGSWSLRRWEGSPGEQAAVSQKAPRLQRVKRTQRGCLAASPSNPESRKSTHKAVSQEQVCDKWQLRQSWVAPCGSRPPPSLHSCSLHQDPLGRTQNDSCFFTPVAGDGCRHPQVTHLCVEKSVVCVCPEVSAIYNTLTVGYISLENARKVVFLCVCFVFFNCHYCRFQNATLCPHFSQPQDGKGILRPSAAILEVSRLSGGGSASSSGDAAICICFLSVSSLSPGT